MPNLGELIEEYTIIPAVRDLNDLDDALKTKSPIVFLLTGSILDLEGISSKVREAQKALMINVDLLEGIASDKKGIEFLAKKRFCDGIISTKTNAVRSAMKEKMLAIQRVFLIDSGVLKSIRDLIGSTSVPDAFEILPAIAAPYFIENIHSKALVIAGGLITKRREAEELFEKGVRGISTSAKELWF
ncbi:MAG TPA: glycerol-3-phosphate responsive antiterminator [Fervidobacterium sp.]|nr:glycerol-3-phosphate responsive antiterminator [Fervidobacterium sp.]HQQ16922.1 glycerol-3-phosphate responsive antiterminator [Fervidobacterium sp.]